MPTPKSKKFFADTTVIYYRLHGHPLQEQAVRDAVGTDRLELTNFVRGEYIRGFIPGLIGLYSAIKEENSVPNGIQIFTSNMGGRPRRLSNAFNAFAASLAEYEDWQDVSRTLRRLGEYIRNLLLRFDAVFVNRFRDRLACAFGVMEFPRDTYDEQHLFDFYVELENNREEPACDQCLFRRDQIAATTAAGIDLYSVAQQANYRQHKGYLGQAKAIEQAVRSPLSDPSCWHCDRLGDTIIALSAPDGSTILTGDTQSFPALTAILGKPMQTIPSLQQLRQKRGTA